MLKLIEQILMREGREAELLMIATAIIAEHNLTEGDSTDADEVVPTLLH